jgi:hypothetical protein
MANMELISIELMAIHVVLIHAANALVWLTQPEKCCIEGFRCRMNKVDNTSSLSEGAAGQTPLP